LLVELFVARHPNATYGNRREPNKDGAWKNFDEIKSLARRMTIWLVDKRIGNVRS
jgi:hypothetical protein